MANLKLFQDFMEEVLKIDNLRDTVIDAQNQYNLKKYKITEISSSNPVEIYQTIVEKFYKGHNYGETSVWVENQLRLFLWTVICYLHLNGKTIDKMIQDDWIFFSKIFYCKEYSLFQYQARTIFDNEVRSMKWRTEEDQMLYNIITINKEAKWNQVAKSLFLDSQKEYIRTAKQCRERWLNHLDPTKTKSSWKFHEYIVLFQHVRDKGKQWALLVKKLNDRRSQHTIKNKYNAIMKKQQRLTPMLAEEDLIESIITRARRLISKKQVETNDEFIFGSSVKNIHQEQMQDLKPKKKANLNLSQEPSYFNDKLESFRKKLARFTTTEKKENHEIPQEESEKKQNHETKKKEELNQDFFSQKQEQNIFYEESSQNVQILQTSNSMERNFKDFMDSPNCQLQ